MGEGRPEGKGHSEVTIVLCPLARTGKVALMKLPIFKREGFRGFPVPTSLGPLPWPPPFSGNPHGLPESLGGDHLCHSVFRPRPVVITLLASPCRPETDFPSSTGHVRRGGRFWLGQAWKAAAAAGARMDLSVLILLLLLLLLLL